MVGCLQQKQKPHLNAKCVKPRFLLCVGNLIGSFQLLPKFHCFQCGEGCVKLLAINNEKYLYNSVFAAWLVTGW